MIYPRDAFARQIEEAKQRWDNMTLAEAKAGFGKYKKRYWEQYQQYMKMQEENEQLRRAVVKLVLQGAK